MSYYYKQNFTSSEVIFAEVKEELRSYFDTGIVDDLLFPRYVEDCLKSLGRGTYKILNNVFKLENYSCKLPNNFEAVRELWLCTSHDKSYELPTSCYEQKTFNITPSLDRCADVCVPEVKVTLKTTQTVIQSFSTHHLLKPGNISVKNQLSLDSLNNHISICDDVDTFDIRDGKIYTNFPSGTLYMVYYVVEFDEDNLQMIPDDITIKNYLKAYLKYKCFETIWNNTFDETFKQVESKFMYYKREKEIAMVCAETEIKKQTLHQMLRSIKTQKARFNPYRIS